MLLSASDDPSSGAIHRKVLRVVNSMPAAYAFAHSLTWVTSSSWPHSRRNGRGDRQDLPRHCPGTTTSDSNDLLDHIWNLGLLVVGMIIAAFTVGGR
ncbi:hypothetical protein ACJZ2D_011316 [Fusarium nematophilum]